MWFFIKDLLLIKGNSIAKEMVDEIKTEQKPAKFKLSRMLRRNARRNKFKKRNTTNFTNGRYHS
ncbi:MAG: hypothetical protein L3J52_08585 [Proteobacteria bacterium]|nr:hypothetical protein [Pseudomonadota bacterium]